MLLERYDDLLNGRDIISDDDTLLGDKIDSRKSYFRRLNMGGGSKSKSFRSGSYRHGNFHSNRPISQRVLVKAHFKKHAVSGAGGSGGAGNLRGHLSYITRNGAGMEEERPVLFGSAGDDLERSDFYNLCKDDRHHFRFIISPENAHEIADMEGYIRGVMGRVEGDLGTKLEWVSAVHYDTDHPHAHVVVRGKDELGRDLVIEPHYISHGIRMRAEELATEILGERSIEEIQKSMEQETCAMRVTSLDRFIAARASEEEKEAGKITVDTREKGHSGRGEFYDGLVQKRLEFLTTTSMAVQEPPGVFTVRLDYLAELKEISERHDIIKQLHRSMPEEERGVLIYDASSKDTENVRGRVEKIAFVNELTDHKYMVVRDGYERAHYVPLAHNDRSDALLEGQIVEVSTGKSTGGADANIAFIASENGGVYTREAHIDYVRSEMSFIEDPEGYVDYHGVRLQTLEKAEIVEQGDEGYRVPDDLEKRGEELNKALEKSGWKKKSYARVKEICSKPLESQIDVHARTFIDLELYRHQKGHALSYDKADKGTMEATHKRMEWLVEHGYAYHRDGDGQFVMKGDALSKLYREELETSGQKLASVLKKPYVMREFEGKQIYNHMNSKKIRYLFEKIELASRTKFDETVVISTDNLNVEHIMPQKWSSYWPLSNSFQPSNEDYYEAIREGDQIDEDTRALMENREVKKHCIGNLTVITGSLNTSIGNESWPEKQKRIKNSLLKVNQTVANANKWDEEDIDARGENLSEDIIKLWAY